MQLAIRLFEVNGTVHFDRADVVKFDLTKERLDTARWLQLQNF